LQFGYSDILDNKRTYNKATNSNVKFKPDKARGFKRFLQKNSAFYLFLAERYNSFQLSNRIQNSQFKHILSLTKEDWMPSFDALHKINLLCKENSIKLIVLYIPQNVEVLATNNQEAHVLGNEIEVFCKKEGVILVNILSHMRDDPQDYYQDFSHLSKNGHQLVKTVLAETLLN